MLKPAGYKGFEVYNLSKKLAVACYELTHELPAEEKNNFTRYIRTAALNLHVNIAQGIFRKRKKRKKFFREAKKALIIIDAAAEILVELKLAARDQTDVVLVLSSSIYQLLDEV